MEKEALLGIILNDLKEVESLVQTFKGKTQIMPAFINLSIQKIDSIKQELELLNLLTSSALPNTTAPTNAPAPSAPKVVLPTTAPISAPPVADQTTVADTSEPAATTDNVNTHVAKPWPMDDLMELQIKTEEAEEMTDISIAPTREAEPTREAAQTNVETKIQPEAEHHLAPQTDNLLHRASVHPDNKHDHFLSKHAPTLGESLVSEVSSVLDRIHATKESGNPALIGKTVDDIKKAIGINDRFLFQRELFENNPSLMNQTIDELNRMTSVADAQSFILTNFNWDPHSDTTEAFLNIVRRKFK